MQGLRLDLGWGFEAWRSKLTGLGLRVQCLRRVFEVCSFRFRDALDGKFWIWG